MVRGAEVLVYLDRVLRCGTVGVVWCAVVYPGTGVAPCALQCRVSRPCLLHSTRRCIVVVTCRCTAGRPMSPRGQIPADLGRRCRVGRWRRSTDLCRPSAGSYRSPGQSEGRPAMTVLVMGDTLHLLQALRDYFCVSRTNVPSSSTVHEQPVKFVCVLVALRDAMTSLWLSTCCRLSWSITCFSIVPSVTPFIVRFHMQRA